MSAPSTFHFYEDTFARLSDSLETYIGDTASAVIGAFTPVAYTMFTVYVILWGLAMLRGAVSEPVMDAAARFVRMGVILGVALNLGHYNTYLADFLWESPEALAAIVASGHSDAGSNVQFLDAMMGRIYDLGDAYWQLANAPTIPNIGLTIIAILTWAAGICVTAYGAFLLALSKMALAILLGLGPIFVLLLMFDSTRRFFDAWIGQALNFVFLVVLTAGAIRLILTIIHTYLDASGSTLTTDPRIDQALPAIVISLIGFLVMMQLPSIASALGGGVAISTLGAAGAVLGAARRGVSSLDSLRPTSIRRSMNRAQSDLRILSGAFRSMRGRTANTVRQSNNK